MLSTSKFNESLWLDDTTATTTYPMTNKIATKINRLAQHLDGLNTATPTPFTLKKNPLKSKPHRKEISNPILFNHVSHYDHTFNFGLENSFPQSTLVQVKNQIPNSTSMRVRNEIVYNESNIDPSVKAVSSYRTLPSPSLTLNKNNMPVSLHQQSAAKVSNHQRNSSSSTFISSNSLLNSAESAYPSDSSLTSNNSLVNKALPSIPQEFDYQNDYAADGYDADTDFYESEDEDTSILNKFVSIPNAPPPPSSQIEPFERLNHFIQECEEIEVASDSDDDDLTFEKFKLSSSIDIIHKEIESNFQSFNRLKSESKSNDSLIDIETKSIVNEADSNVSSIMESLSLNDSYSFIDTSFELPTPTDENIDFFADLNFGDKDL